MKNNEEIKKLQAVSKLFGINENEFTQLAVKYNVIDERNRKLSWWMVLFIFVITAIQKGNRHLDRVMIAKEYFNIMLSEHTISERLMKIPSAFLIELIKKMRGNIYRYVPSGHRKNALKLCNIIIEDASAQKLDARCEKDFGKYPGGKVVAAKYYMLFDALTGEIEGCDIKEGRYSDCLHNMRSENAEKDSIELRDRAWYGCPYFKKMVDEGRYFITRTKSTFNPKINKVEQGREDWEGEKLKNLKIDYEGEIRFKFYPLQKSIKTKVALKNGEYLYLTAVGKQINNEWNWIVCYLDSSWDLSFNELYSIYRFRWNIETLFKELKSGLGLKKIRLRNKDCIYNYFLIIVIAYVILNKLLKRISDANNRKGDSISKYRLLQGSLHYKIVNLFLEWLTSTKKWRTKDWKDKSESIFTLLYDASYMKYARNRRLREALTS